MNFDEMTISHGIWKKVQDRSFTQLIITAKTKTEQLKNLILGVFLINFSNQIQKS